VIKSKRADLRDIQQRIRDQMKLCYEEIGIGGRWGSKPPPGTRAPDLPDAAPDPEKKSLRDLQDMFQHEHRLPAPAGYVPKQEQDERNVPNKPEGEADVIPISSPEVEVPDDLFGFLAVSEDESLCAPPSAPSGSPLGDPIAPVPVPELEPTNGAGRITDAEADDILDRVESPSVEVVPRSTLDISAIDEILAGFD
jgi:hypothetical protein